MRKRLLIALLLGLTAAALAAGGGFYWAQKTIHASGPLDRKAVVLIEPGQGVRSIARLLEAKGVLKHGWLFAAYVRVTERHTALRAGEYAFAAGVSPRQVLEKLQSNDTVVHSVTVPEGLTAHEIIALINATPVLRGTLDTVPMEGTLLPETYHYSYGDSRRDIVQRMQAGMKKAREELWPNRREDLPIETWRDAVTLASIVEKETAVAEERPRVASVFVNRLRRGMRLQSDPTVIYALTDGRGELDRPLTREDWKLEHPYNTYVVDGLPPGPIANPGRAALRAVLNPAQTDDLYFVADGSGGHAFARTLREHNRNVAHWRRIRDKNE